MEQELKTGCDRLAFATTQLAKKGWAQGAMRDWDGRVCLLGALIADDEFDRSIKQCISLVTFPGMKEAVTFLGFDSLPSAARWNDDLARSREDVLDRIEAARAEHCATKENNGSNDTDNGV